MIDKVFEARFIAVGERTPGSMHAKNFASMSHVRWENIDQSTQKDGLIKEADIVCILQPPL